MMVLIGSLEELLTMVNVALYRKYLTIDSNGNPIMYKKLQMDLYGYICVFLLFYENLAREIKAMGFLIKTYDLCVTNKIVNGK